MKAFSADESTRLFQVEADIGWKQNRFFLEIHIQGPTSDVLGLWNFPDTNPIPAAPTDDLWKHTCFEAFLSPTGATHYYEINLSSFGHWMVYRFDSERTGRVACPDLRPSAFEAKLRGGEFRVRASVDFSRQKDIADLNLDCCPALVLENTQNIISYWSLVHGDKPDFHRPAHRIWPLKAE